MCALLGISNESLRKYEDIRVRTDFHFFLIIIFEEKNETTEFNCQDALRHKTHSSANRDDDDDDFIQNKNIVIVDVLRKKHVLGITYTCPEQSKENPGIIKSYSLQCCASLCEQHNGVNGKRDYSENTLRE